MGGSGMVGANLVPRLLREGFETAILVRPGSNLIRLGESQDSVRKIVGDVTSASSVHAAFTQVEPDVVFHLASTPFNPPTTSAEQHVSVNVTGTVNLLEV